MDMLNQVNVVISWSSHVSYRNVIGFNGAKWSWKKYIVGCIGKPEDKGKVLFMKYDLFTPHRVEGEILLNGKEITKFFHRYIGYVEQSDIHYSKQTV